MKSGRVIFFLILGLGLIGLGWLLNRDGWEPTWSRWGMTSRSPFFSDLRVVTGAMDSIDQGYDPMVSNPGAPWHQFFNQPRLWLHLFDLLEVREKHSGFIGIGLLVGFVCALIPITAGMTPAAGLYCGLLFFSSASLLAVERCNLDIMMFILLAVAQSAARRSSVLAALIFFAAFMLKLFPLAGALLLLRESRNRAVSIGAILLGGVALYFFLTWDDMRKIFQTTERGAANSYGYNVLWHYLRSHDVASFVWVRWVAYLAVAISLAAAWWFHRRPVKVEAPAQRELDGYRIGAGVYVGTFLLGNSWDYRLIFFFFCVPQLFLWSRQGQGGRRLLALGQLIALAVASWAMWLTAQFAHSHFSFDVIRGLEEAAKWTLFTGSLWLLADTLPNWARAWLRLDFRTADATTG